MAAISRPLGQLVKLYLLVAVAILTAPPAQSKFIGYDCTDAPPVGVSPVSDMIPTCDFEVGFDYVVDATLLLRNASMRKIVARQCIVRYNESSASDSPAPLMSAWTYESIDRATCLGAHETEKLILHGQVVELDIAGTKKRIHTATKIRDYEITLKTHLATVFNVFNLLKIENTEAWCNYDEFECDYNGGKVFWEADHCKSEYQAVFSGHVHLMFVPGRRGQVLSAGRIFAVAEMADKYYIAFQVDELHSLCSSQAYKTKSWNWEVALSMGTAVNLPPNPSFLTGSLDARLYDDVVHVEDGRKDTPLRIARRLCEKQKAVAIANLERIRETSVWDDAHLGTLGEIQGDLFVLRKCSPVEVRRRRADSCYNRWPIFDHLGREKFMCGRSRIITDNATRVPCSWETLKPKVEPTSELEDFLSFVTAVGAFSSGLWTMRFALGFAFQFWFVRGVQQEPVQHTNDSRLRKCMRWMKSLIDSFFVLIEPPFYS